MSLHINDLCALHHLNRDKSFASALMHPCGSALHFRGATFVSISYMHRPCWTCRAVSQTQASSLLRLWERDVMLGTLDDLWLQYLLETQRLQRAVNLRCSPVLLATATECREQAVFADAFLVMPGFLALPTWSQAIMQCAESCLLQRLHL